MASFLEQVAKNVKDDRLENLANQKPAGFVSTGSLALNAILTGNTFNGIQEDTITALCGASNSGKSYILAHIVKNFIDAGYEILLFDSERAVRADYYTRIGCDASKIMRRPVGSVSEFRNKAYEYIPQFYEISKGKGKLFLGLDSLGNLASEKELADAEKNKTAADQGNAAKGHNSAFRIISSLASDYNFPCVFTNHVYSPIGDLFAQRDVISGGKKAIFNSHQILYFERLVNKEEVETASGEMKKVQVGMKMKITTVKNRNYPEEKSVYVNLRYDEGMNPYSGLLDFAIRAGVIENKPRGYLVTATGKTVYDDGLYTPEVFDSSALAKINDWLGKNGYSCLSEVLSSEVAAAVQDIGVDNEEESEKEGKRSKKK